MSFRKLAAGLVGGLAAVFILQNLATVEASFLFWSFRAPRALLLLVTFGAGGLVGFLLGRFPGGQRPSNV